MSYQQTLVKPCESESESVSFIDEPPEGGNQALKAQLGIQIVIPYVHFSKYFIINVVLVHFMHCLFCFSLLVMICHTFPRQAVLCCAVLCCAVLCCAVLCCAVLCCAVM